MRKFSVVAVAIAATIALGACGSEGIDVDEDADAQGAELFAEKCSGCHTLGASGSLGSANRALRNQGPNLDERTETTDAVLYAIQNGGFSGAIMPQQILTGEDAEIVADFVAKYAGSEVDRPPRPEE